MKNILLTSLLLVSLSSLHAEEVTKEETPKSTILSVLMNNVNLSGYGQMGYTYNSHDDKDNYKPSNTFDIKRIIFVANGQITKKLNMYLMLDLASGKLHEYWGEYKFCDAFKLRAGQFKTPFTLENPMSPAVLEIIDGSQGVQYLAGINGSDICYGGKAGRDIGLMASGELINFDNRKLLTYKVGIFNGQGINTKDKNNHKDFVGSLMVNPFQWISLGGSAYIGKGYAEKNNLFGAFNAGDNYLRNRWSLGTEIHTKPIYLRAEYLNGKDAHVRTTGGYVTANIHIVPKFDFIASYDYLDKNKEMNIKQTNYVLGAQWNFYRRCRLQAQYVFQDRNYEHNSHLVVTQFQLGF
ncbi:MAG: porin [Bacteroidaceae bacterium]